MAGTDFPTIRMTLSTLACFSLMFVKPYAARTPRQTDRNEETECDKHRVEEVLTELSHGECPLVVAERRGKDQLERHRENIHLGLEGVRHDDENGNDGPDRKEKQH